MQEEIIDWAKQTLNTQGYQILAEPSMVRSMPWSEVMCFVTSQGNVYLKSMAPAFSNEPRLLHYLNQCHFKHVPILLAQHEASNCFLMKDAGANLREKLKQRYDVLLVAKALQNYAQLQVNCIHHVNKLFACGVSDYRLSKLPEYFQTFFTDHLDIIIGDGLSLAEVDVLKNQQAVFSSLCHELEKLGMPETLEQGDFHDNNLLIKDNEITIHDFGDACISHPFFSIVSYLHSAGRHHVLTLAEQETLKAHYLQPWASYAESSVLMRAYDLAYCLRPFVWALNFVGIFACEGMQNFPEYKGYLTEALRTLLKNLAQS
ncbi:phosphotransferase [Candidatus Berkiella aquae]|uniref:Aminoglycoside phosphotransferase family protein n=1 Tax=Candidatus Berkiella aquae TaxID=295108 RepID=A0A0Q9Z087_9GAMM|nr:phosphotransferase [Candidatus Berkiella aquae]MCS5712366.1 aminoglycoside phosphotransferase family protein [Candidatus Berkiella aquae]